MAVAWGIARISLEGLVKANSPFLMAEIGVLFLCSYVPVPALWIPRLGGLV
jgi:TRAP-type C4-dicarboxylate transport system permease large subunit